MGDSPPISREFHGFPGCHSSRAGLARQAKVTKLTLASRAAHPCARVRSERRLGAPPQLIDADNVKELASGSGDREERGTHAPALARPGRLAVLRLSREPLAVFNWIQARVREWDKLGVAGYRPLPPWANLS